MSEKRSKIKPPRRSSQDSESSSSSESTSSPSSEDEEIDARDLKPIKEYLNDRRVLASQLFKSVKLEKIRMMLPQSLKSMDLYDLEEFCGNELSGMSRKRILSIINGQRMTDSSDTDETDDSGPSLEIISDTEEWLTDEEVVIKDENTSEKPKRKKHTDNVKGKTRPHSKDKTKLTKTTTNQGKSNRSTDVIVKLEDEKTEPKEGESLLDLLELEMRARAIRALIRKEEDIIPGKITGSTSATKNNSNVTTNVNASTSKYVVQEMQQISVTLKQGSGLDDDVMLVIQPAPTIELLSSESENEKGKDEGEQGKRVNKKLENEREKRKEEEEQGKCANKKLENEREKRQEEENKQKLDGEHEKEKGEQSKRINKRLENERGTETTLSTSTIGDETVEIPDNDIKIEEHSPRNSENPESKPITVAEKSQKSSEKVKIKKTNKVLDKSPHDSADNESIQVSDRTTDKIVDKSENTLDTVLKNSINKVEEENKIEEMEQKKISDEETKTTNESKNATEVSENTEVVEKSPEKQKSPDKELEEGELASESDSKEKDEVVDRNNKKHSVNKRFKRRCRRSKVSESSQEESEDLDQSEVTESEKGKSKLRKKIRDNTVDVKEINSKEPENGSTQKTNITDGSGEKKEMENEAEGIKEERGNQNEVNKNQDDFDKADMEEIIDLDDYPDDMDDLENNQQITSNSTNPNGTKTVPESSTEKSEPAETWASRYYNTDDVQNVIKESKIQSEIRKRLRERQRLSKLNNSPNVNKAGSNSPDDIKAEEAKQKPVGSVEEYLALKAATAASDAAATDSSVNKKSQDEKSGKSRRKRDSSHKSKSHSLKRRSKSDKKSSKDDENSSSAKTRGAPKDSSVELRPD